MPLKLVEVSSLIGSVRKSDRFQRKLLSTSESRSVAGKPRTRPLKTKKKNREKNSYRAHPGT